MGNFLRNAGPRPEVETETFVARGSRLCHCSKYVDLGKRGIVPLDLDELPLVRWVIWPR